MASKIFDARRLIEVDVCEKKEVTKISLVPLDSCAYTSEELIIPSATSEQVFGQYSKRQHSMLMQMRLRIGIGLQKRFQNFKQ